MSLDQKFSELEKRERALQRDLDNLVTQLFKYLRPSRDGKGRLIASFAPSAESVASDVERVERELQLIRDDIARIKSILGDFSTIDSMLREIKRIESGRTLAQKALLRQREIALRGGVPLDRIDEDRDVKTAKERLHDLESNPELDHLKQRFAEIKLLLAKY